MYISPLHDMSLVVVYYIPVVFAQLNVQTFKHLKKNIETSSPPVYSTNVIYVLPTAIGKNIRTM